MQENRSIICYAQRKKTYSLDVCRAFAQGCGGKVVWCDDPQGGPALISGQGIIQQGLMNSIEEWWEADHAYFGRMEYHRITHLARWHSGVGEPKYNRLAKLGIKQRVDPLGKSIVVILQSDLYYRLWYGATIDQFKARIGVQIRKYTKRPIIYRQKPLRGYRGPGLEEHLRAAHCVVTLCSGVALECLRRGIPVCVLDKTYPAARLGCNIKDIEQAPRPEPDAVRQMFGVLAANQWTVAEMRSGQAWEALSAQATN